ncbi:MAG: hypothetical protein BWY10_00840 [Chloroflexi bacterium ADurb.Bin180]|nr:MAG: hypothetical protein BWY10_00840 [Chloroflexi bacterium ADurb.Bin180]
MTPNRVVVIAAVVLAAGASWYFIRRRMVRTGRANLIKNSDASVLAEQAPGSVGQIPVGPGQPRPSAPEDSMVAPVPVGATGILGEASEESNTSIRGRSRASPAPSDLDNARYVVYWNRANSRSRIHLAGCKYIRQHGGEHKYGEGGYRGFATYEEACAFAAGKGWPFADCGWCLPTGQARR